MGPLKKKKGGNNSVKFLVHVFNTNFLPPEVASPPPLEGKGRRQPPQRLWIEDNVLQTDEWFRMSPSNLRPAAREQQSDTGT